MRQNRIIWIQTSLISVFFYITGKLLFRPVFAFFEPSVDGILFRIRELDNVFRTSVLFAFLLALIPLMMVFLWLHAPVVSVIRRWGSVAVIAAFMALGALLRHQQVKMYFIRVVRPFFLSQGKTNVDYPIDPANFVYYMFGGLCIGWAFSWLLLRQKKMK